MKGICFKEPLFRATLEGSKIQTRRIMQNPKEGLAVVPVKKPRGVKKIWTPERVELLKSMSVGEAATYFGVTEGRIHNLRHQYGIARKYAKGQQAEPSVRVKQRRSNPPLKSQLEGIVREEQQNRHEEAKRVAAEHGARATEGKVSVRVDPRTTVLMSPERAAAFNKLQHDNRNHYE